jgi:hypothetical protein
MLTEVIDGVKISGNIIDIHPDELKQYVERGKLQHPDMTSMWVKLKGDEVELRYFGPGGTPVPFDRIRRISGYLVGSLSKWNDAKRAEEADRVKHGGT